MCRCRLLRVFHLAPGVAERCALTPLCWALRRRIGLMKSADLQLVLSDLAAIYTPQFLPLFESAARALKRRYRAHEAAARASSAPAGEGAPLISSSEGPPLHADRKFKVIEKEHELLSPLQVAFILHSYGQNTPPALSLACRSFVGSQTRGFAQHK